METNVIRQIKIAFSRDSKLATSFGTVIGSFVPVGIFSVVHLGIETGHDAPSLFNQINTYIAAGGLLYSATSVYQWMSRATRSGWKGLGWCVLAEGIMTFSGIDWLAYIALVLLCFINGVALGSNMALDEKAESDDESKAEQAREEMIRQQERDRIEVERRAEVERLEAAKAARRAKREARQPVAKAKKEPKSGKLPRFKVKETKAKKTPKTAKKSRTTEESTVRRRKVA